MSQNQPNRHSNKRQRQNRSWLPVLLVLGGLVLVGLAYLALREQPTSGTAVEVSGAPRLKVDKEQVDLGDMKFDQPAQVTFQLTNVGDQILRFTKDPYIEVVEGC